MGQMAVKTAKNRLAFGRSSRLSFLFLIGLFLFSALSWLLLAYELRLVEADSKTSRNAVFFFFQQNKEWIIYKHKVKACDLSQQRVYHAEHVAKRLPWLHTLTALVPWWKR